MSVLDEAGIEIPFPQRDLHLKTGFDFENITPLQSVGAVKQLKALNPPFKIFARKKEQGRFHCW